MRLSGPRLKGLTSTVLLLIALVAGAWKILDLSAANRALDRQNQAYASSIASVKEAFRSLREGSLKRGSAAAGFTLLGLDRTPVRLDPHAERGPVHLLFVDPAEENFEALLENYRETFARAEPRARVLILTERGYEETSGAIAARRPPYPIAVHAAQVYRTYGILDGPGFVAVENGVLREKWRLPFRRDELPIE